VFWGLGFVMEIKRLNVRNGFFIYLFIFCFEKLESLLYGIALLLVLGWKRDLGLGTSDLVTLVFTNSCRVLSQCMHFFGVW